MNQAAAAIPGNMDVDPLLPYEYPAYDSYAAQAYPYPSKLQQSIYQAYQQTNTNYINTQPQEPVSNPQAAPQTSIDIEIPPKKEETDPKPVLKKRRKEKNGQKSTYCSEKITDAAFKFYGCAVCNVSYNALHDLDQHVTVHKNRMTSYRLRLRNQFKKKQIKKEKKKLKKLVKIKKENELDVEIKPEDGYIGEEKATDFINNGINPNSELNGNVNKETSAIEAQNSQINTHNDINSTNSDSQSNATNCSSNGNSEDNRNNMNCKENSMDEAELNNLEKIYKCFACQKQFTLSYYLKLHVRSHTDEKPYTCAVCGQSFITASKLGRHNKRIHLAERYQCRICFKVYSRFELLTAHFDKTHPEDKLEGEPYDYNAILPYLKELEEQLLVPEQEGGAGGACERDSKPHADELFWEQQLQPARAASRAAIKEEALDEDQKELVPKLDILIEEVKVDFDVTVKRELSDDETPGDVAGDVASDVGVGDVGDVGDVKDEDSHSDEDYFPENTWAAPPAAPSPAPPPPPERRRAPRTCEVCHKSVSSASYMRVHMRTHTGERPFKCYTCGRGFITSSKMHRHVLTHAQDKDEVKAEGDDTKPEVPDEAAEHKTQDGVKKPAKKKSKMKSKTANTKNSEEKPRRKHQKRPHACEFCNQKFLHLNMLEVHTQSHAGEALVLRCHYCLLPAPDEAARREHEATHTGAKPYACTLCGNTYKKRETMVYHRKRHAPDAEFVCDVCSKRFSAACKLRKHLLTHRRDGFVLRYECPVCAHMFHTKYHVHMHLSTHQKEGLILEENRSEILAMVLQNARKIPRAGSAHTAGLAHTAGSAHTAGPAHTAGSAHTAHTAHTPAPALPPDERSRVCNICGDVFSHFYYLEEHLKSHGSRISIEDIDKEEEKKYICTICNKGFKLHYYLKLHSFTHSKEKPFICQQCGKGFITKGKLKRHLETHTGLKKYQCHICYKFFTRPSYLRIHVRTIHGTQDYNFRFDKGYGLGSFAMSMTVSDVSQNSV